MSEEAIVHDDASHYEISLTAAQAFVAFVLLLLSLAASFAFGVIIGKGQVDDRLVVRREPTVINETAAAAKNGNSKIVELGVENNAFTTQTTATDAVTSTAAPDDATGVQMSPNTAAPVESISQAAALSNSEAPANNSTPAAAVTPATAATPAPKPAQTAPSAGAVPYFAQLLSTSDAKTAEALAARLIDGGFKEAYVERSPTDKGMIYRVRVKFANEADARAAVDKLRSYSKGDVWVTKQ